LPTPVKPSDDKTKPLTRAARIMTATASHLAFAPQCLATGIGSLPFTDTNEALDLVFTHLPEIPHWPQLPRRSPKEHFIHQFCHPLVACALLTESKGRWGFDLTRDDGPRCLTAFYDTCLPAEENGPACQQSFLPDAEAAAGLHAFLARARTGGMDRADFVKGQIAGPLSIGLELKDHQGRPAYYNGDLRDTLVRTLALGARGQAAVLAQLGPRPLVFIDDPAVSAWGSRLHLALDKAAIIADLDFIIAAIHGEGALAGLHACEALDWSLVLGTGIDVLSLDAYRFAASLAAYRQPLGRFLEGGGVVAWGIVPTLDDPFAESVASLEQRLNALWSDLFEHGPDRSTVLRQSLITPSCGAGLTLARQARRIYELTAGLSRRLRGFADKP